MTTGRINQVANPSSTRGEQARHRRNDSLWVRGPWGEGRWAGLPRGTPEERCCAARGRVRVPDRRGGWRSPPEGARTSRRSAGARYTFPLPCSVAVAVVLGTRGPVAHPFGTRSCEPTRSGEGPFRLGFGLGRGPVAWSGPYDAQGIEFPTDRGPFGR